MEPRFIYKSRSDDRIYDAATGEMRGGPDKVIVYLDGVLCTMDHDSKIAIRVSRWKLMEIGLACCLAALKGNRAVDYSDEPLPLAAPPEITMEQPPEPLAVAPPKRSEDPWDRLMREMRDLSR